MEATEPVQITLQLLKYVMYAGVTFPNDSCGMTLVYSKCTQIFYWCHLATNALQPWTESWGKKTVSSCKFRAALVSALISINFILFDKVSQTFLANMVAILNTGELCNLFLTNSIFFVCFENIYIVMVISIWAMEIPSFYSTCPWLTLSKLNWQGHTNLIFHY